MSMYHFFKKISFKGVLKVQLLKFYC